MHGIDRIGFGYLHALLAFSPRQVLGIYERERNEREDGSRWNASMMSQSVVCIMETGWGVAQHMHYNEQYLGACVVSNRSFFHLCRRTD